MKQLHSAISRTFPLTTIACDITSWTHIPTLHVPQFFLLYCCIKGIYVYFMRLLILYVVYSNCFLPSTHCMGIIQHHFSKLLLAEKFIYVWLYKVYSTDVMKNSTEKWVSKAIFYSVVQHTQHHTNWSLLLCIYLQHSMYNFTFIHLVKSMSVPLQTIMRDIGKPPFIYIYFLVKQFNLYYLATSYNFVHLLLYAFQGIWKFLI